MEDIKIENKNKTIEIKSKDNTFRLEYKDVNMTSIDGSTTDSMYKMRIYRNGQDYHYINIIPTPTGNCQVYSIGNSKLLFHHVFTKQEILSILKECQKIGNKNQLLIDIESSYEDKVEDIFSKYHIVFKQQYANTKYGTKMTMYLLKTDFLT